MKNRLIERDTLHDSQDRQIFTMGNSENNCVSFKHQFVAKTNRKNNNSIFTELKQDKDKIRKMINSNFSKMSRLYS